MSNSHDADIPKFIQALLESRKDDIREITLKRNEVLTRYGDVEQHIYWVESGAVRAIYLSGEEEQSIRFGYAGSLINALPSYFSGRPSQISVEALRKTIVQAIPRWTVNDFIQEVPERQQIYILLMENLAVQQHERELDLLTSSPAERLKRVMERSPQVFQEIPAKYIASYLRMSPETLSRLRKGA